MIYSCNESIKPLWRSCVETVEDSCTSSTLSIKRAIKDRGGFAQLCGTLILPSQFRGPTAFEAKQIVDTLHYVEKFCLGTNIHGIIYYPHDWNQDDHSKCVLYHNPNGITLAEYFENGNLSWTPGEILRIEKCPIILYDYRGSGLNKDSIGGATYYSIVEDGLAALTFALKKFLTVKIWGSSLGGGVATASLYEYLTKSPLDKNRLCLYNHDSFTTTTRVVRPSAGKSIDCVGSILGAKLDAYTPMKNILEMGVQVTVICHLDDPVIPQGARMMEYVENLAYCNNLTRIYSDLRGHANLSEDIIAQL